MILIIAYGNSLRRDDGAGFVLARTLEGLLVEAGAGVQLIECHQLAPELAMDIAREEVSAVVFADTRVLGPGDDRELRGARVVVPRSASASLGHGMDASVLMVYAGLLFKKEVPAWLITVPGTDFDHGEGFSESTRRVLEGAPETLGAIVGEILKAAG